jgi:ketosteroid isomerase-like protein
MSEENVELVRQGLNAWIEVDEGLAEIDWLGEFFAPDSIIDMGDVLEVAGAGKSELLADEFLEWRAAWIDTFDDYSYGAEKILDAGGNDVAVTYHQRGKPRGSDSWVEWRYGIVYTVEDGLVTRGKVYSTPEETLEAAGLSE